MAFTIQKEKVMSATMSASTALFQQPKVETDILEEKIIEVTSSNTYTLINNE